MKKFTILKKTMLLCMAILLTSVVSARDIYVKSADSGGDDLRGGGNLNNAVATLTRAYALARASVEDDRIIISGELIEGTGILLNDTSGTITFISHNHADVDPVLGVQGVVTNSGGVKVFSMNSVNVSTTIFSGLQFTNNIGVGNGGFFSSNASGASATFIDCVFTGNTTTGNGNFNVQGTTIAFANCVFDSNSASNGSGGVMYYSLGATVTITNSLFKGNSSVLAPANSFGGAIAVVSDADVTITGTTFYDNSSELWGGAVYNNSTSNLSMTNVTMFGNSITSALNLRGSAYRSDSAGTVSITNSLIYGNTATASTNPVDISFGGAGNAATITNSLAGTSFNILAFTLTNVSSNLAADLTSSNLIFDMNEGIGAVTYVQAGLLDDTPVLFGNDGEDAGAWSLVSIVDSIGIDDTLNLNEQRIKLPVEIFGLPSNISLNSPDLSGLNLKLGIAERIFTIDQAMLDKISSVDNIYLQINNASYEDKIAVSVNAEPFTVLNNSTTNIYTQELARGGMTHGGYNSIRLKMTSNGFKLGQNKLRFRFEKTDGISSGFRIIDLDILDVFGNRILKENPYYLVTNGTTEGSKRSGIGYYYDDDPELWEDPYTEDGITLTTEQLNDSVSKGKDLWYYGSGGSYDTQTMGDDMWSNYLPEGQEGFWYGYNTGEASLIKAKCTHCHTQDGRDLEMFSYSNLSIIERAKFHRLTEEEGKLLAAYIRSLSATDGDKGNIHRYGRPWNPPYQPGPQLADKPIEEWAAGAGLDAVLEKDEEMLPYLFPNGTSQEEVYNHFDSDATLDRTELPLAIQFPDWKHWLPMIHPMDAYAVDNYWNNDGLNFSPVAGYARLRGFLQNNQNIYSNASISETEGDDLLDELKDFWREYRFFLAEGDVSGDHWRSNEGTATSKITYGVPREFAATSLARMMGIQFFELMNEFSLQDKAQNWYGEPSDHVNKRQWIGTSYHVFEIPAHFQACVSSTDADYPVPFDDLVIGSGGDRCQNFYGQSRETGQFESSNWYHLQSILSGGEGMMEANTPVDYNYQQEFVLKASKSSAINEPLRYFHVNNTMYQTKSWSGDLNPNDSFGFRMRVLGPWVALGKEADAGDVQFHRFDPLEFVKYTNDIEPELLEYILNAQLRQFLKEVYKPQNRLYKEDNNDFSSSNENWWRFDNLDNGGNKSQNLDSRMKTQIYDVEHKISSTSPLYADHIYWYLRKAEGLGVDCNLLYELKTWAEKTWPNINEFIVQDNQGIVSTETISWDNAFTICEEQPPFTNNALVTIQAKLTDEFFSIENGQVASLSSKTVPIFTEKFSLEINNSLYNIRGSNDRYMNFKAENISIRVQQIIPGATELFSLEKLGLDDYAIKGSNNKYLSYDNVNGYLFFNADVISDTEIFRIHKVEELVLAINDSVNSNRSLRISPNPVGKVLSVLSLGTDEYVLNVYDFLGKKVLSGIVSAKKNSINISHLENGNYILILKGAISNKVLRFIKN